jgi:hypothetical protein
MIVAGLPTWGHQNWTTPLYRADTPAIVAPERTTVLLVGAPKERPLGWLTTLFAPEISFIGFENTFPASRAFVGEAQAIVSRRNGPVYAVTNAPVDRRAMKMAWYDDLATRLGLTQTEAGCGRLRFLVKTLHQRAVVEPVEGSAGSCRLGLPPDQREDMDAKRRQYTENARQVLKRSGFLLDAESCKTYAAGIGDGVQDYQFCTARPTAETSF